MSEADVQHYLNPLTLEAQLFLNSLDTFGGSCNQIDPNLCKTLENVVVAIDKFVSQRLSPVVATKNTKLILPHELNTIRRTYHCSACNLDLGKSADKAAVHLADRHKVKSPGEMRKERRKAEQDKRDNMVLKLPKKAVALISNDLSKFFTDNILIAEKLKYIPEYDTIEKELLELIIPLFPQQSIKLYKFGSRITGIGTRNSDLDIFVDIGNTFNKFENQASPRTQHNLIKVRDILLQNRKAWLHMRAIENARVPILRVVNGKTGIECDIGFSNSLGHCNTNLMEYLFNLQPIARRMCIFLKKWIERTRLNDISTYSISLMVIYFLQINKYLPSIEFLQFGLDTVLNVGPWIANFTQKKLSNLNIQQVDTNTENCKIFMKLFFKFYADFNFSQNVVCPFYGKLIEICKIEHEMPERYSIYVNVQLDYTKGPGLALNKCMIVQDPIQLNHNVTKALTPIMLKRIVNYFRQSAETFAELK